MAFFHLGEVYTPGDENVYLDMSLANPLVPEQHGLAAVVKKLHADWATYNNRLVFAADAKHEKLLNESKLVIRVGRKKNTV